MLCWNLFLQNRFANSDTTLVDFDCHHRSQKSILDFVDWNQLIRIVDSFGLANNVLIGQALQFFFTSIIAFEDEFNFPNLFRFAEFKFRFERLTETVFEILDRAKFFVGDQFSGFVLGQFVTGDMLFQPENTLGVHAFKHAIRLTQSLSVTLGAGTN